mmetsp:Transcript_64186/g.196339  ORF Transcript_64186/g.196339 Transcript_64186/m.196339 type:complete len:230 (-) Transcript_64186:1245-1934(-)
MYVPATLPLTAISKAWPANMKSKAMLTASLMLVSMLNNMTAVALDEGLTTTSCAKLAEPWKIGPPLVTTTPFSMRDAVTVMLKLFIRKPIGKMLTNLVLTMALISMTTAPDSSSRATWKPRESNVMAARDGTLLNSSANRACMEPNNIPKAMPCTNTKNKNQCTPRWTPAHRSWTFGSKAVGSSYPIAVITSLVSLFLALTVSRSLQQQQLSARRTLTIMATITMAKLE